MVLRLIRGFYKVPRRSVEERARRCARPREGTMASVVVFVGLAMVISAIVMSTEYVSAKFNLLLLMFLAGGCGIGIGMEAAANHAKFKDAIAYDQENVEAAADLVPEIIEAASLSGQGPEGRPGTKEVRIER